MNVKQTKFTLKYWPARRSVLVRGKHGLGKSEVVKQTAAELSQETGKVYEFIDIRLSQREVGDIIGLPRSVDTYDVTKTVFKDGKTENQAETVRNVMIHDLPVWFPRDPDSCGIIFLDELDRASREVQQAGFELVLDYRLNLHRLPEGWRVVSAINGDPDGQGNYQVLEMDPALCDRFFVIDFKPTVPEWLDYAKSAEVHDAIVKYITKLPSDLDTPDKIEPGQIYQSRRAWVMFSDAIKHLASIGHDPLKDLDYLHQMAKGYLGTTLAQNFTEYVRTDYRIFSPEEILNKFDKDMEKAFGEMEASEVAFYSKIISEHVKDSGGKLTDKQGENLKKFYLTIPKEAAAGFWRLFLEKCRDAASKWYKDHPEVVKHTMGYLGKK